MLRPMTWLRHFAPAVVVSAVMIGYFATRGDLTVERIAGVIVFLVIAAAVAAVVPSLARKFGTSDA